MVSLVYPELKHYEAYLEACKKVSDYVNSDQDTIVARRETKNFEFAEHTSISKEDFSKLVASYKEAREVDFRKKSSDTYPHIQFFVMDNDTIIGMIDAEAKNLKDADIENGVKPVERWHDNNHLYKAEFREMLLPEYRGKGLNREIKALFFDSLRNNYGIDEITATVFEDNDNSNNAQKKLVERYGGKSYKKKMNTRTGEIICNAYIISTDTSGNSKYLYHNDRLKDVRQKLALHHSAEILSKQDDSNGLNLNKLRGIGQRKTVPIHKTTLDSSLVRSTILQNEG